MTVAERVREGLGRCSPAERRVGRALLADYPAAGLDTVASLAGKAQTSGPTVLRFSARLGFAGFADMQEALRRELGERETSPLTVLISEPSVHEVDPEASPAMVALARGRRLLPDITRSTLDALPPDELETACSLLANTRFRVIAEGGRFTRLLAEYLVLHLMQVRGDATVLPVRPVERTDVLMDVGRRDVVVLFDFRRYEEATQELAAACVEAGARVILVTDRWLSPISSIAHVVLPVRVEAIAVYDSLTPALAVVELLVAGVIGAAGDLAERRLARFEDVSHRHGIV